MMITRSRPVVRELLGPGLVLALAAPAFQRATLENRGEPPK